MRAPVLRISFVISLLLTGALSISTLGICLAQTQTRYQQQNNNLSIRQSYQNSEYILTRIKVFNTNGEIIIDQSVTQGDTSYWLSHSIDGKPSIAGTITLDKRCRSSSQHLILYGHRIGSRGMFGPISRVFLQESFNQISHIQLTLINEGGEIKELSFTPYCAARIKEDNQLIQRASFTDSKEYYDWLTTLYKNSSAQGSIHPSTDIPLQSLTLITCSEAQPHQPWRCVFTCIQN